MLGGWYREEEIDAVVKAICISLDPSVGFIFFCDEIVEFEQKSAECIGTTYALLVTSAGTGLDVAVRALDLEPGDEVIVPATNFRAAPYAVLRAGAKLVLCDSDETLNASPTVVLAYDPCLSCSTHAQGVVPMLIELLSPDGTLLDTLSSDS
jgi:dTDP-4-amino-4,6-dideoxygalactose transaminase